MPSLILEAVEGPDAGRRVDLSAPLVVGRDATAELVLAEPQVSRSHARIAPSEDGAVVEDLGSTNGTFVNGDEIHGPTLVAAGDQILIGTTVLLVRTEVQVDAQPSAVRPVPPALAVSPRPPDYIPPGITSPQVEDLTPYLDARTKAKARMAPLALVLLAVLAVVVYLAAVR